MLQVENEYGSYGEDKDYLVEIKDIMVKYGVNVPLLLQTVLGKQL